MEDARRRGAALGSFVTNAALVGSLRAANESERGVPEEPRERSEAALRLVTQTIPAEVAFDAVFAIDRLGRVVAHLGFEWARGMDGFELGGYAVVADALHGHSRDDTLVMDRVYRVVARPVEDPAGEAPVGAVMGARAIDEAFARELSQGIGSALVFFDARSRIASSALEGIDPADLSVIVGDLDSLPLDPGYRRRGTSGVRDVGCGLNAVYARLPGEGWPLGRGWLRGDPSATPRRRRVDPRRPPSTSTPTCRWFRPMRAQPPPAGPTQQRKHHDRPGCQGKPALSLPRFAGHFSYAAFAALVNELSLSAGDVYPRVEWSRR